MNDSELRAAVTAALGTLDRATEQAIRWELATIIDLGDSGRLQFEIDPITLAVQLTQTENEIVEHNAVYDALAESVEDTAEAGGLDVYAVVNELALPWLADRWRSSGGPERYRPAYAFFHGGPEQPRYDLERRRWVAAAEVWPDAT